MIPPAKLTALRESLKLDEPSMMVNFKTGSIVTTERRVVVKRAAGGIARFGTDDAELARAYEMALHGPMAKDQLQGAEKFGDEAPF